MSSFVQDLRERVRRLERAVSDMQRGRSTQPYLRELRDAALTGVADGQVPTYDAATGLWIPGSVNGTGWDIPPFTRDGALATFTSHRYYPPSNTTFNRAFASLEAVGSTATTIDVVVDGTVIGTVTIAAGQHTGAVNLVQALTGPETSWVGIVVTSAGTSAAGLCVQLYQAPGIATLADEVLSDSPLAFWPLAEAAGTTAVDASGNGHHGTYTGGYLLAQDMAGVMVGVDLNGSTGYVDLGTVAAFAGLTAWTVEGWCVADATPAGAGLFTEVNTGGGDEIQMELGFGFDTASTSASFTAGRYPSGGPWAVAVDGAPSTGVLYHLVATWDGSTVTLYVDGVQVATVASTGVLSGGDGYRIGLRHDVIFSPYFPGKVANVAVYDHVLTPARIAAHHAAA